MDAALYIGALRTTCLPYFRDIQNFNFYFHNPVFWAFFMVSFLMLKIGRSWSSRKAFFFCASVSSILLGATWLKNPLANFFTINGSSGFDPFVLKMAAFVAISIITIYFVFIDNS